MGLAMYRSHGELGGEIVSSYAGRVAGAFKASLAGRSPHRPSPGRGSRVRRQAAVPTPNARNGSQPPPATGRVCCTCRSAAVANAVRPCIVHTVSHALTPATGTQSCIALAAWQRWLTPQAHVSLTWCYTHDMCMCMCMYMYQSHGVTRTDTRHGRSRVAHAIRSGG